MFDTFIQGTNKYSTYYDMVPAPIFRKSFNIDFKPESCNLKICTSGFYELYVNEENITRGFLSPYISNPDHILYYDEYEIASYLNEGKNAICIVLGNGFANQDTPRQDFKFAKFRAPLKLALSLKAISNDKEFNLNSDESFKTHPSPYLYDMYRFGVIYDARKEIDGCFSKDYDDSEWDRAIITTPPLAEIKKNTTLPVTTQKIYKPKSIEKQCDFYYMHDNEKQPIKTTYVKEGWVYDFGYNMTGICKLKIKGKRGQKITLRHGEALRNNVFNLNSMFTVKENDEEYMHLFQADTYILKGDEEEIFIPSFTYHGFRYVLVEGIKEHQATSDLISFIVFNTDIKKKSDFKCSDEILNTLYEMAIRADLSNFHHFPTDCPHREKNGWTGDVSVSAHQYMLSFDCGKNFDVWLENIRYAQKETGQILGSCANRQLGLQMGLRSCMDSVIINLPYYTYKYSGSTDMIKDNKDMIMKYLNFIKSKFDEKGLVSCGLGDWCQPGKINGSQDSPLIFTDSSQTYETLKRCAFLFDAAGYKEEALYAKNLSLKMKKSIRENLIDFNTYTVIGNCQTSQAVALKYRLFEEDEYKKAYNVLLDIIKRDDYTLNCGMIGLRNIFHVLCDNGDSDIALKLIKKKGAPSYMNMIELGGTALFESIIPNGRQESQNHHFYGDIINLFICKLAGLKINPCLRDIKEIEISPVFPKEISYAYAEYKCVQGKIETKWEKTDKGIKIYANIPKGIYGKAKIENIVYDLEEGINTFDFKIE